MKGKDGGKKYLALIGPVTMEAPAAMSDRAFSSSMIPIKSRILMVVKRSFSPISMEFLHGSFAALQGMSNGAAAGLIGYIVITGSPNTRLGLTISFFFQLSIYAKPTIG